MAMNSLQLLIRGKRWDDLIEYLSTEEGRDESIRAHDDESYEPLHEIFRVDDQAPLSIIEAILDIFPNEPSRYSRNGWRGKGDTALQLAIVLFTTVRDENRIILSSIMAMLKSCPEAINLHCPFHNMPTFFVAVQYDKYNSAVLVKALLEFRPELARVKHIKPYKREIEFPLTFACERGNNDAIEVLLDAYPEAAMLPISSCQYPLHVACGQRRISPKVIERVMSVHPPAVFVLDRRSRSVLHLACLWKNFDAIPILIEADPSAALKSDVYGNLPLHLVLDIAYDINNIYYPSVSVAVFRTLLNAYRKGMFHYNGQRQLPNIHCFLWSEWLLRNDDEVKQYFEDRNDEHMNYKSQRELLLHLLTEMYHQIYFVSSHQNGDGDKNDFTNGDEQNQNQEPPPASIWHVIAIQSTMYTTEWFDRLIYVLTELQVIVYPEENTKVLEMDHHGNNLLHLFFLSQTEPVLRLITETRIKCSNHSTSSESSQNDSEGDSENEFDDEAHLTSSSSSRQNNGDDDNENDFDDEADSTSSTSSQHHSEEDSEDELDDEDSNVCQERTYAFEDFMESVDEQTSVWTMSKQWNHHGELPLHIFLKKPCQEYINYQFGDKMEQTNNNNVCIKYDIMIRLMKYHPSAVSERERNKSGLMPFMIAAVHSNKCSADETRDNECIQCLSCIYELLRSAGVDSCHIMNGGCCCSITMDHPSKEILHSSDQGHDAKKRRVK